MQNHGYFMYSHLPYNKAIYEFQQWCKRKVLHLNYMKHVYNVLLKDVDDIHTLREIAIDYVSMQTYFMSSLPSSRIQERVIQLPIQAYHATTSIFNVLYNTYAEYMIEKIEHMNDESLMLLKDDLLSLYAHDDTDTVEQVQMVESGSIDEYIGYFISIQIVYRYRTKGENIMSSLNILDISEDIYEIQMNDNNSMYKYMQYMYPNENNIEYKRIHTDISSSSVYLYLPVFFLNIIQ